MSKEIDNIELRSEKVRNIIGQIPPRLFRVGISIIFLVFIIVLIGTYFFKYDYVIKTTVDLKSSKDSILARVRIPANQIEKVKKGQVIIIYLDNIPHLYGKVIVSKLKEISQTIQVSNTGGNLISEISLPKNLETKTGESLELEEINIVLNAEIQIGKVRLFNKILDPFFSVFKIRQLKKFD